MLLGADMVYQSISLTFVKCQIKAQSTKRLKQIVYNPEPQIMQTLIM